MIEKTLNRILYAEDEEDIRAIAQIALEDIGGFTVKYCSSGQEVLDVIDEFKPDLILLDVMMPGLDGILTLKTLRQKSNYKDTPAVFMTAKIQSDEVLAYKEMGVLDVISKPFDPMTLADIIKKVWEKQYAK